MFKMKRGTLTDEEIETLKGCKPQIECRGLVFDFHSFELQHMLLRMRRMQSEHGIKMFVIDYCQMIQSHDGDNKEQRVAAISNGLKSFSM
ncbi:MAG: hypothetical protein IIB88_06050, partial [Chloroflexi bacterium]|nr:hypothetical protein [Chloroflexota bacterium]